VATLCLSPSVYRSTFSSGIGSQQIPPRVDSHARRYNHSIHVLFTRSPLVSCNLAFAGVSASLSNGQRQLTAQDMLAGTFTSTRIRLDFDVVQKPGDESTVQVRTIPLYSCATRCCNITLLVACLRCSYDDAEDRPQTASAYVCWL
jgi:hypothetical protein